MRYGSIKRIGEQPAGDDKEEWNRNLDFGFSFHTACDWPINDSSLSLQSTFRSFLIQYLKNPYTTAVFLSFTKYFRVDKYAVILFPSNSARTSVIRAIGTTTEQKESQQAFRGENTSRLETFQSQNKTSFHSRR